ncbi:nuclear transport factor 2 family protein [Shewanella sp. JM162201]|uniref:Nuclear transport factor 2 family protein n=1 Tax=Shewanella jiangmenensis TaxID=2837387 RepID=A0ABS5V370_9GAMM|nr:nuclear transport factor 2 family protein [Shewanella jiangmenensis]MBT1444888.1 nuclear transport factor 2 family protein [Shewanella jiangmenensis]
MAKPYLSALALLAGLMSTGLYAGDAEQKEAAAVLDALHRHAAHADWPAYFALYSQDAVFIGTDASERWNMGEFRRYAEPTKGWDYQPTVRHFIERGEMLIFDELLTNAKYGTTRGTGAMVLTEEGWKVVQYHLSIPVPNEVAKEVTATISAFERKAASGAH